MKRSPVIALTILATLQLAACADDQETQRAVYSSRQACVEDWGSEDDCEAEAGGTGMWMGPWFYYHLGRPYYFGRQSGIATPLGTNARFGQAAAGGSATAVKTVTGSVSRGGFGSSASLHGASS
ncbi:MAG: hypothetical protein AB1634_12305 [Thermodesulfobacteriota bacterium]